jgi:hypothetical protein
MSLVEYKPPAKPKAATPLEFFEAVYMNLDLPLGTRLRAATEAAKYVHPRLEAIATYNHDGGFAERLKRLHQASAAAVRGSERHLRAAGGRFPAFGPISRGGLRLSDGEVLQPVATEGLRPRPPDPP